jgi:hypothetical protein
VALAHFLHKREMMRGTGRRKKKEKVCGWVGWRGGHSHYVVPGQRNYGQGHHEVEEGP